MGVDPKRVMADFSESQQYFHGIGRIHAYFSKEHKFHRGHGIVGGQIPLGAGMAFGDKYFNRDNVTFVLWVTELSDKAPFTRP